MMNNQMLNQQINDHIERIRRRGSDDAVVEAKASVDRLPKSVWDSVSAFANTEGGIIILGLDEANGFIPAEGFNPTKTVNALLAGFREGPDAKVSPIPPHQVETVEVDGSFVVVVTIDPLRPIPTAQMPCFVREKGIQRGSFKRVDEQDLRLSPYEIYVFETLKTPADVDRAPVPGVTLDDLSETRMRATFEALRNQGSHALDDINTSDASAALKRLNLMTPAGEVTLAAYLVLGKYPQQHFPQLTVDVSVHPTTERSAIPQVSTIDRRNCDGPIPLMIEDALNTVARNLTKQRRIQGIEGIDVWEIPLEVLREAITNAVMHRDYGVLARGQQIAVDVYPDRVEVINPGGLWGTRTITNLADSGSSSRNELLTKFLAYVPREHGMGAVCENMGSGVKRMIAAMRAHGLPAPDYSGTTLERVVVRLDRVGVVDPDLDEWLDQLGLGKTETKAREIMALAWREGALTVADVSQLLGIDTNTAKALLTELTNDAHVVGDGDIPYIPADAHTLPPAITPTQQAVLDLLDTNNPKTIRELADESGRSLPSLRQALRPLLAAGYAVATAPATSKHRAYRKAELPRS